MVAGGSETEEDGWSGDDDGEMLGGGLRVVDRLRIGWGFGWLFGVGWVGLVFGGGVDWGRIVRSWVVRSWIVWGDWGGVLLPNSVEGNGLVSSGEILD